MIPGARYSSWGVWVWVPRPSRPWWTSAPSLTSQERTRRWLLLAHPAASRNDHVPITHSKFRPLLLYICFSQTIQQDTLMINTCMMSEVLCKPSRSHFYTKFLAVNELGRDVVHLSMCCLLVVAHLGRLSRICPGRRRPCSRRLQGVLFSCFFKTVVPIKCLKVLIDGRTQRQSARSQYSSDHAWKKNGL